jgi:hypothetical protein
MVAQVFIEHMRREEAAPYAWIIDIDHLEGPTGEHSRMGTTGPSWAADEHLVCLANDLGYGRRFRMRDSDGVLYYSGRLLDEREEADVEWAGPLDDFGRPNDGCTTIEYYENGKWVEV